MKLNSGLKLDTSQARDTSIKIDILLEALLQLEQIRETVEVFAFVHFWSNGCSDGRTAGPFPSRVGLDSEWVKFVVLHLGGDHWDDLAVMTRHIVRWIASTRTVWLTVSKIQNEVNQRFNHSKLFQILILVILGAHWNLVQTSLSVCFVVTCRTFIILQKVI